VKTHEPATRTRSQASRSKRNELPDSNLLGLYLRATAWLDMWSYSHRVALVLSLASRAITMELRDHDELPRSQKLAANTGPGEAAEKIAVPREKSAFSAMSFYRGWSRTRGFSDYGARRPRIHRLPIVQRRNRLRADIGVLKDECGHTLEEIGSLDLVG
jgi:hypothetical protein